MRRAFLGGKSLDQVERGERRIELRIEPGVPDVVLGQREHEPAALAVDQRVDVSIAQQEGVVEDIVEPVNRDGGALQQ